MKLNKYLGLGAVAVATSGGSFAALAANLDTFDTFTSGYAGGPSGFVLASGAGGGTFTDGTETLAVSDRDSGFASLTRRVTLTVPASGSGSSDLYNGTAPSTPQGYLKWGNVAKLSTVELFYNFPVGSYVTGKNLTSFSQFDLDWDVFELGASVAVQVTSAVGLEGSVNLAPTVVPVGGPNYNQSLLFSSFIGNALVWDSVRSIKFTLTTTYADLDIALDNIGLSNPNVPEASTALPAVGLAGLVGLVAWKRRSAK